MTSYLLIALLLIIIVALFYVVCSLMHPEIKSNTSKYSEFNIRTHSNISFSMDSDFAAEKISKVFPDISEDKLETEYEYFLHSIDLFYYLVPSGLSFIAFWICVSFDVSFLATLAVSLLVFTFAIISMYLPKGMIITLYYHFVGTLYKFSNTLWLNKIISIVILIVIGKPIMIVALILIFLLQLIIHLALGFISAIVSGITLADATAYNVLGHIIHEHHTVFKWVELNRQYIDVNHKRIIQLSEDIK